MKPIFVLLAVMLVGCGTPHISRNERVIHSTKVRSFVETAPSHTDYVLGNTTIDAHFVSAVLVKESHCKDLHFSEFSDQVVHERDQENVLLNLLIAGGAGSASVYGLVHAESLSDARDPTDPDKASPRESMLILSWLGLGTSVAWAGYSTLIGVKAIDAPVGVPSLRVVQSGESNHRICDTEPAVGQVAMMVGDEVTHTIVLNDTGTFNVDIGANPEHCGFEDGELKFYFQEKLLFIAPFKQCAQANLIRRNTQQIQRNKLENPTQIFSALHALSEQEQALGDLVDYLDYDLLAKEVADSMAKVRERAIPVVQDFAKSCAQTLRASVEPSQNCLPKTLEAYDALSLDVGKVFETLLDARLIPEGLGQDNIQAFYAAVPEVQACVLEANCPTWLNQTTVQRIVQPHAEVRIKAIRSALTQAEAARKKLEKQPSIANLHALDPYFEIFMEFHGLWCKSADFMGMKPICGELKEFATRFEKTSEVSTAKIREDGIKQTAQAWRGNFALCRQLNAGIKELQKVPRCNAECQSARKKMQSDYDNLRNFAPENPMWDEPTLKKVRSECQIVGCPRCP